LKSRRQDPVSVRRNMAAITPPPGKIRDVGTPVQPCVHHDVAEEGSAMPTLP
jgi:hypothetical protein